MKKLLTTSLLAGLILSVTYVQAGSEDNGATDNVYYGADAGTNLTIGGYWNSFFGYQAGYSTTSGDKNTFSGYQAGGNNTTGSGNTFSGNLAGFANTTGFENTFSGVYAGRNNFTGSNNVFLGYTAGYDETGSNKLYIHSDFDSHTTPLIYGEFDNRLVGINGKLGIGTQLPTSTVHVQRADGTAQVKVEETSATASPRTLFQIANNGNTKFGVLNTQAGVEWSFANGGSDFRLSRQGSGVVEFTLSNAGNLTIQGNLTELSSRTQKHNIIAMNSEQVLNKVLALPINEWSYNDSKEGTRHVGPMAEDFHAAFGLGESEKGIATLDTSGVALAAIQGLNQKLTIQDKALAEQDKKMIEKDVEILALQQSKASQDKEMVIMQSQLTELTALVQRLAVKDQRASLN